MNGCTTRTTLNFDSIFLGEDHGLVAMARVPTRRLMILVPLTISRPTVSPTSTTAHPTESCVSDDRPWVSTVRLCCLSFFAAWCHPTKTGNCFMAGFSIESGDQQILNSFDETALADGIVVGWPTPATKLVSRTDAPTSAAQICTQAQ